MRPGRRLGKEARNKSWHLCKVCGVPELCGTQPYTTGVRLEQHPATSGLWNPKWRVPFLSQTPIRTGSPLPLHEHMSLIKHAVQWFAWHDLSTDQRCCKPVICKSRKTLKTPKRHKLPHLQGSIWDPAHSQAATVISAMTQLQQQNYLEYFMLYCWWRLTFEGRTLAGSGEGKPS